MSIKKAKNRFHINYEILLITSIVLIVFFGVVIGINKLIPDFERRGLFGDSFGVVNAMFSGLAFAGLIYTIIQQSKEISYQREELRLTREEMERNRVANQQSAIAQEKLSIATDEQLEVQLTLAAIGALRDIISDHTKRIKTYEYGAEIGSVEHTKLKNELKTYENLEKEINLKIIKHYEKKFIE